MSEVDLAPKRLQVKIKTCFFPFKWLVVCERQRDRQTETETDRQTQKDLVTGNTCMEK